MNAFSETYRSGRKFTRRRERQMAFLKALGETGSVAHAASIVDVDRTMPYTWCNTRPDFALAWETVSSNESLGVPRCRTPHRQIPRKISRLAAGARLDGDVDRCPTDSPGTTISSLHASAAHGASPATGEKANENKEVNAF